MIQAFTLSMSACDHLVPPAGICGTLQLPSIVRSIEWKSTLFVGSFATTRFWPEHAVEFAPTRFVYAVILFAIDRPPLEPDTWQLQPAMIKP